MKLQTEENNKQLYCKIYSLIVSIITNYANFIDLEGLIFVMI